MIKECEYGEESERLGAINKNIRSWVHLEKKNWTDAEANEAE